MEKTKIYHIKTGGTISGCVPEYREIELLANIFPDMVNLDKFLSDSLKVHAEYEETTICHKDSRDVTDADRENIVTAITEGFHAGTKKFLVTHGTYTMPETGIYISEHVPKDILDHVMIIITGSMFPWTVLGSDAPLNLGAAIGILLNVNEPQVSICMHAKLFNPYKITKNLDRLIFEEV